MRIYDLVDPNVLQDHLEAKRVAYQFHPTLPLVIYNYTQLAQFDPHWGDGTIDYCRGLIVNRDNYEIVSRPFKKFHNLNTPSVPETMEENLPAIKPTVTKKYDGSLGIYYNFEGYEGIATRGSFTSDQAKWATNWYEQRQKDRAGWGGRMVWPKDWTPLFEIIYSGNRIVVDYPFEGLVLIGEVNKETGQEKTPEQLSWEANCYALRLAEEDQGSLDELKAANKENEEGYVLTYPRAGQDPIKVKVKMADYVRLHRVVTGMNPRGVWELLKSRADFNKFNTGYPLPFVKWLNQWRDKLLWDAKNVFDDAYEIILSTPMKKDDESQREYRKRCAAHFALKERPDLKSVYFLMLDNQPVDEVIWDMIEPAGNDATFRKEGE